MMKGFQKLVISLVFALVAFSAFAEPIDINTANATAISEAMVGVGEAKAEAIVEYRKAHGAFKTIDELSLVKGIGEKTVEKNRANITVSQK